MSTPVACSGLEHSTASKGGRTNCRFRSTVPTSHGIHHHAAWLASFHPEQTPARVPPHLLALRTQSKHLLADVAVGLLEQVLGVAVPRLLHGAQPVL